MQHAPNVYVVIKFNVAHQIQVSGQRPAATIAFDATGWGSGTAKTAICGGIEDHFCQQLLKRNFSCRIPLAGSHYRVRAARDWNEVPD
jgi:hypothetical protein